MSAVKIRKPGAIGVHYLKAGDTVILGFPFVDTRKWRIGKVLWTDDRHALMSYPKAKGGTPILEGREHVLRIGSVAELAAYQAACAVAFAVFERCTLGFDYRCDDDNPALVALDASVRSYADTFWNWKP
jgi:hypothetical protein